MTRVPRFALLSAGATAIVALAGCSAKEGGEADLVAGKKLFVQKCGACHVLNRAGTKGTTGPSLDQAFQQDVRDGFGESAIRGVVYKQIGFARTGGVMPQNLVKGEDARDVAAYVARVVAQPGKDTGLLASAVKAAGSGKPALAKGGKLSIPADPGGQLAFASAVAQAPAGKLTIEMPNTSGVQHNIAIDGKGTVK
jgi:mono/diheme cytochrome c family protein